MTKQIASLADLVSDDRNANAGTPRGRGMVETSLQKYGAGRSVLVDRNGKLIAGNKTSEAAAAIGLDKVQVVQTDGSTLVVVQRTDLDLDEDSAARELAIADNRAGELGLEWDVDVLASLGNEIDLSAFWSRDELAALIVEDVTSGGGDEVPEVGEGETRVKPGELWQLGRHRLLCGDSTKRDDVERLMGGERANVVYTDPPYGYDKGIEADETVDAALRVYGPAMTVVSTADDAWAIVDTPKKYISEYIDVSEQAGWLTREPVLHMYRNSMANGVYGTNIFELSFVYSKGKPKVNHRHLNGVDVARKAGHDNEHPTQKFVDSYAHYVEMFAPAGGVVYDAFAGSGTTLIACERTGRRCYGIEIEPRYCDVILKRWEAESGQQAERID